LLLFQPGREFIEEGVLEFVKAAGKKPQTCIVILFNDILLLTQEKMAFRGKKLFFKKLIPLKDHQISDTPDPDYNAFTIHRVGNSGEPASDPMNLRAKNPEEKKKWMNLIRKAIEGTQALAEQHASLMKSKQAINLEGGAPASVVSTASEGGGGWSVGEVSPGAGRPTTTTSPRVSPHNPLNSTGSRIRRPISPMVKGECVVGVVCCVR
jgi:hypothetical protein